MRHWGCFVRRTVCDQPAPRDGFALGLRAHGPRGSYLAYATNISNFSGLTATWQFQHGTHSDYIAAVHAK